MRPQFHQLERSEVNLYLMLEALHTRNVARAAQEASRP